MRKIRYTDQYGKENYLDFDEDLLQNNSLIDNLYFRMNCARYFEQSAEELYAAGLIHGTLHLAIGQEAAAIGTTIALDKSDKILVTHRGHQELIGKGVDPYRMFCELLSKKDGISKGFGGSMHMVDKTKGVLHANGIVAANAPLACGVGLALKQEARHEIVTCYVGDGGMNEGAYSESLNLASLWHLPVVFATVNNQYGMSTPLIRSHANSDLSKRGAAFFLPTLEVDGNDVLIVYQAMQRAREMALSNQPVILILNTYRISGHSRSDQNRYRTEQEIAAWQEKCPIKRLEQELLISKLRGPSDLALISDTAHHFIEEAKSRALTAEPVDADRVMDYLYQTNDEREYDEKS